MAWSKDITPEERRERKRRANSTPEAKEARRRYRRTEKGRAAEQRKKAALRERHPEKYAARVAMSNAVRDGRLVKGPCEQEGPGCSGPIEGHHDDYGRPLQVRWLCSIHHNKHHGKG